MMLTPPRKELIMKAVISVLALIAVATPAFAQSTPRQRADLSRAQIGQPFAMPYSAYRGYGIYDPNGNYVGTDPDPLVRQMLQNDQGAGRNDE
jgi:hypothetical protein